MKKLFIISLILLVSCVPVNNLYFTEYIVPAGLHYSLPRTPGPTLNVVSFNFKTNDTWIWEKPEPSGWSKIAGICWRDPHNTSARVVFDGEYIGAYFYINGETPMDNPERMPRLFVAEIDVEYYCQAGYRDGTIFVRISNDYNIDTTVSFDCDKQTWPAYFLQPYVGGRYVLDNNWNVPIRLN